MLKPMTTQMKAPRDGILHANGLMAEFRFLRAHRSEPNIVFVETAVGDMRVQDSLLEYDPPRDLSPEAAAVVGEHKEKP